MANNGTKITAPISDSDIRTVTGVPSNDIGYQIYRAKTGGTGGWAFKITENGFSSGDGELINGARPYWNIFSNNSPGEWIPSITADGPIRFQLKRFMGNSSLGYGANMHEFDGYEHNAVAPEDNNITHSVPVGANSAQNIGVRFRTGSYDWRKVSNTNYCKFVIYDGNSVVGQSDPVEITAINMTIVATIKMNISTVSAYTKQYKMRLILGRRAGANDFNSFGYVPSESTLTIEVYKPLPLAELSVRVGVLWTAFDIDQNFVTTGHAYMFNAKYRKGSGIPTDGYQLKKIIYKIVNASGAVGATVEVTSNFDFPNAEYPLSLGSYVVENNETFYVSRSRLRTTPEYPQLQVSMFYTEFGT